MSTASSLHPQTEPNSPRPVHSFPSPAPPATPSAPVIPFSTRSNKLTVQESLNAHLTLPTSSQIAGDGTNKPRVKLTASTNPADYDYRIAYERAMERSEGASTVVSLAQESLA